MTRRDSWLIWRSRVALASPGRSGGASRDRTGDLLVANQTLSQLSYGPSRLIFRRLAALRLGSAPHIPFCMLRCSPAPRLASRQNLDAQGQTDLELPSCARRSTQTF